MPSVCLAGRSLHAGIETSVSLSSWDGPVVLEQGIWSARLDELRVIRTDLGVMVAHENGLQVDLVEHLLSAVGGLGVAGGVRIRVQGPEVPLLDGGSLEFAQALQRVGFEAGRSRLRIAKRFEFVLGESMYRFLPGEGIELEVDVHFDHPEVGHQRASWDGSPDSYLLEIAASRTFGWERDAQRLRDVGRGRWVDSHCVMVLAENGKVMADPPPRPGEFARHKLLDLIGDLRLAGGLMQGRIQATRPGHTSTHRAVQQAIEAGALRQC